MLSVLIPVYNTDVRHFAQQLLGLIEISDIEAEVIVLDDGSQEIHKNQNRILQTFRFFKYEELGQNIGRSKIRNLLAEKAKYDWLLFMDGDSQISDGNFLTNYIEQATDPQKLIYGGTTYGPKPIEKEKYLHWMYGTERECLSAEKRNKNKFGTFKTNNFLVHRNLFMQVKFDETVKGYGHEDTLFAQDLERKGFDILHIENPLWHEGLEDNNTFIVKQQHAIVNLVQLYKQGKVGNEIKIIWFYNLVKRWKLLWLIKRFYLRNESVLLAGLFSEKPKLGNLDRLKMGWFLEKINGEKSKYRYKLHDKGTPKRPV